MRINNDLAALNTYRRLNVENTDTAKSLEKLSSGLRINKAEDDAAGLAISEKMRAQVKGIQDSNSNAQNAVSLIQIADSALGETHSILQKMRELAAQAKNDTNVSVDKKAIQKEVNQLYEEINGIADNTTFNKQKLLDGSLNVEFNFQIQTADKQALDSTSASMNISIGNMSASALDIKVDYSGDLVSVIPDTQDSSDNVGAIDAAIKSVADTRTKLAEQQQRLEGTIAKLDKLSENLIPSNERVRDKDMAKEMLEYTQTNILNQAATAMLAQANQQPAGVLQLLR